MSTATRILGIIRPHLGLSVGALACMGVGTVTTVGYAVVAGPLLAAIHAPDQPASLLGFDLAGGAAAVGALAATVLAITVAKGLASYGRRMLTVRLGQRVVRELRERMYEHLLRAAPEVLVSQRRGELASRLATDALQVQALVTNNLSAVIANGVSLLGLVALTFGLDPTLAVVALLGVPPIAALVFVLARRVRQVQRRVWEEYGELSSHAAELGDKVPIIRAYGAEARALATFRETSSELERRVLHAQRWSAFAGPATQILGGLAIAAALMLAAPRLASGDLTPETFVSFFAAIVFIYQPVQSLGSVVQRVAGGLSALDRTDEVLALATEPPDPPGARALPAPLEEGLRMHGVRFRYRADEPVLDGVELSLGLGESVAIVGGSGEGKTTLLRLILGLVRPDEGTVTLGGSSLTEVTHASWRSSFAWVTQEPLLFADTVLVNVTLSDADQDRERARRALSMAGADALLEGLSNGIDTVLSEGGKELSGGQRQRICIARALYREAPILVFDEATSSLDGPSERAIANTIEELMATRAVVLVSHRLSTVARADRVLVLSGGRIVESGSPSSLWDTRGHFHELFRDAAVTNA